MHIQQWRTELCLNVRHVCTDPSLQPQKWLLGSQTKSGWKVRFFVHFCCLRDIFIYLKEVFFCWTEGTLSVLPAAHGGQRVLENQEVCGKWVKIKASQNGTTGSGVRVATLRCHVALQLGPLWNCVATQMSCDWENNCLMQKWHDGALLQNNFFRSGLFKKRKMLFLRWPLLSSF